MSDAKAILSKLDNRDYLEQQTDQSIKNNKGSLTNRSMKQSFDDENYLAHFGVLGQKWGIRRSPEQLAAAANRRKEARLEKLEYRDKKAKVKAVEAEARGKLADAKRKEAETKKITKESNAKLRQEAKEAKAAKAAKQEAERKEALKNNQQTDTQYSYSDYKRMSDAELRAVVSRLNAEEQYKKYNPKPEPAIRKFIKTAQETAKTAKDIYTIADAVGLTDKLVSPQYKDKADAIFKGKKKK